MRRWRLPRRQNTNPPARQSDQYYSLARDAFQGRDYHNAFLWRSGPTRRCPRLDQR